MQEILELNLNRTISKADNQDSMVSLEKVLREQETALGIILSYYYREQGGLVENVRLVDKINFESPTSGNFKVTFNVVFFNACWDVHGTDNESMLLNFNLSDSNQKLKLYGPSQPERGQDEI